MLELSQYVNPDASSRTYGDGNTAMANGEAAMYLQGPWAFGEIAKAAPDLELGMFPLPVTDDPDDLKARINMDLAAWIPEASKHKEAARAFLEYLYQPEVIQAYNESQLGFPPTKDAPPVSDERIAGLQEYIDAGDDVPGLDAARATGDPDHELRAGHHARQRSAADPQQHRRRLRAARFPSAVIRERRSPS